MLTTCQTFNQIQALQKKIHSYLENLHWTGLYRLKRIDLSERVLQKITFKLVRPFAELLMSEGYSGKYIHCGEKDDFKINLETGALQFSLAGILNNIFEYHKHSIYLIGCLLNPIKQKVNGSYKILYGASPKAVCIDGDDKVFRQFCYQSKLGIMENNTILIVQSNDAIQSEDARLIYARHPLLYLARTTPVGIMSIAALIFEQLINGLVLLYRLILNPSLSLILRDFSYLPLVRMFVRNSLLDSVFTTCGRYTDQPLWMREEYGVKSSMLWYAQNWRPIQYKSEEEDAVNPFLPLIRVNRHKVWTDEFSVYLKKLGIKDPVDVSGPIVWQLPELHSKKGEKKLLVFDVSPFSDELAMNYGHTSNFHNKANVSSFINDIIQANNSVKTHSDQSYSIQIKTKRGYMPQYEREYFEMLESLAAKGEIELLDYSENIYSLIHDADLIICFPYTSPALIADSMAKNAIYYDPSNSIKEDVSLQSYPWVQFCSEPQSLARLLAEGGKSHADKQTVDDKQVNL